MGWFSKIWKGVKRIFGKVTKVVKKIIKSVGKVAKKVWNGVKSTAQKFAKGISKLGPLANIAMNFIPGFGQLWQAYGIWGQIAKGALVGFATTGKASGALLGAVSGGLGHVWKNMPGNTISEKVGGWFDSWQDTPQINKAFGQQTGITNSKYAPWSNYEKEAYGGPRQEDWKFGDTYDYKPLIGTRPEDLPPAYGDPKYEDVSLTGYDAREPGGYAPSLLDKSKKPGPIKWGDTAGSTYPYATGNTGPLTSYDISAGDVRGQVSGGRDIHNIKKMTGLLAAIERIRDSEGVFLKPNYS